MAIIFITMIFKILLGFIYSMKYRCFKKRIKIHKTERRANLDSRVTKNFEEIKESVYSQIRENVHDLMSDINRNSADGVFKGMNSIILFAKHLNKGKPNRKTREKWDASFKAKSKIYKKNKLDEKSSTFLQRSQSKERNEVVCSSDSAKNLRSDSDIVGVDPNKPKKKLFNLWG